MLDTTHWVTITMALFSLLLGAGQVVFWTEIRAVNGRHDKTERRIEELWSVLSGMASRQDITEVKSAVSSLHRRIDALYELLMEKRKEV